MKIEIMTGLVLALVATAGTGRAEAQMRFQGMDRNHDGAITRDEWRGSTRAFENQDWNGDGVLSGDEVRPGARRSNAQSGDWNQDGRVDQEDAQLVEQFRSYDRDHDGRVTADEWKARSRDEWLFSRLDSNHDGRVTLDEYAFDQSSDRTGAGRRNQGGPPYAFSNLDRNNDGAITRNEWGMTGSDFDRLDTNRDNRLSWSEFQNYGGPSSAAARQNGRNVQRSRAEQAGYERGLSEGRQAGYEDREVNGGKWDLAGQRELTHADSGYSSQYGALSEYQAGYREGFRIGYGQGFYRR